MSWRDRLRSVHWTDVAPVGALGAVLVAITVLVGFGVVGRAPQTTSQPPPSPPAVTSPPPPSTSGGSPSASAAPTTGSTTPPCTAGCGRPSGPPSSVPPTLNPSSIPSLPGCLAPQHLAVLTFNIHSARHGGGVDLGRIAAEIRASHADVVLLQEVDRFRAMTGFVDEPTALGQQLHMQYAFGTNVVRPAPGHGRPQPLYGTAILSRYPIISSSNTHLPNRPGLQQRGLLEATITVAGQSVHVFDTHLQNTSASMRVAQIRAVRSVIQRVSGPVVLGGDFNSVPQSAVLAVARSVLHDTWPEIGNGPGFTHGQLHPRIRIDYLLHNDWLTPVAAKVLPSAVSDHRSLWAAYDLWSRPGCGTSLA